MHTICYVVLFFAYTLGAVAYAALFWNAFADNQMENQITAPLTQTPNDAAPAASRETN